MHRTYVGSAERGERNVSLRAIERLADALGVAPADLLATGGAVHRRQIRHARRHFGLWWGVGRTAEFA